MSKQLVEDAWVIKYRAKEFKNLLLSKTLRKRFISENLESNMIVHGYYGTGKSSLIKILTKNNVVLEMNGSTQNKLDDVRDIIEPFCKTSSIGSSKKKVVWIDEGDRLTIDAQKALKNIIEKYEKNVIFVITTNHVHKLQELYSRMPRVPFEVSEEDYPDLENQYVFRIFNILKQEGFTIAKDACLKLVRDNFPDFRAITSIAYEASKLVKEDKHITLDLIAKNLSSENKDLYNLLLTEHDEVKLYINIKGDYGGKEIETLKTLGEPFLEFLVNHENPKYKSKVLEASMIVHKYIYESQQSIDNLITLLACCSSLSKLLK